MQNLNINLNNVNMDEQTFITKIKPYLAYKPDSTNYNLFKAFRYFLSCDRRFISYNHIEVAFQFSQYVTQEQTRSFKFVYQTIPLYIKIRPSVLRYYYTLKIF